jgi:amidase
MKRLSLVLLLAIATLATAGIAPTLFAQARRATAARPAAPAKVDVAPPFSVVEASIGDMRAALEQRRTTSRDIVQQYLTRIALYEDRLNAVIAINPDALKLADERDRERAQGKIRGPLHGIPVALKDNIHTTDMPTTGGALAFEGFVPPYEATLTKNLRDAGAIIIAKTQLTELANFIASGMPGNFTGLTGYGMNPYDPRRDPRENTFDGRPVLGTGGSSSGVGTAVNFWAGNVGTETSGSILSPSNQTMLVGIKPTIGRISRDGVIPITADHDTAGPMTKTVADAAIMLGAMEGATPDTNDPATKTCAPPPGRDYTKLLNAGGLKGARIGIPRVFYYDRATPPGAKEPRGGLTDAQRKVMDEAIAALKKQGAVIVDPVEIPSVVSKDADQNLLTWNTCGGPENSKGRDADCSIVFKYGMKRDFNEWLKSLGDKTPLKTLTDLRKWNIAHQRAGAIKYGQANLDVSDEMDLQGDRARYEADRRKDILLAGTRGIDAAMKAEKLDALLFPGSGGAGIAAKPGYPTVIVPFGFVPNAPPGGGAMPDGFNARPGPYGVSFTGMACSEPKLIELAYAFEQATKKRVPPPLFP